MKYVGNGKCRRYILSDFVYNTILMFIDTYCIERKKEEEECFR